MDKKSWNRRLGVAALALAAAASPTLAGEIGLRWDPVSGASGYRVYYGISSGSYSQTLDVGAATSTTLAGLQNCRNYYVAVKAYNAGGESAAYSNEVSGWARPEVASWGPGIVRQGDQATLTISGANFANGADLVLRSDDLPVDQQGNPLVRLESYTVTNCNTIQASLTVEPLSRGFRAAPVGALPLTFEISNPDSVFGDQPATLTVQFNQERADINRSDAATTERLDGQDLIWLRYAHGTTEGAPRFNADADLDGDGLVDGDDLALLASNFGRCWTGTAWSSGACN